MRAHVHVCVWQVIVGGGGDGDDASDWVVLMQTGQFMAQCIANTWFSMRIVCMRHDHGLLCYMLAQYSVSLCCGCLFVCIVVINDIQVVDFIIER